MTIRRQSFPEKALVVVATAASFRDHREPPHRIGDIVRLNSGGPPRLVLDLQGDQVTIGWRSDDGVIREATLPEICVHRVRDIF